MLGRGELLIELEWYVPPVDLERESAVPKWTVRVHPAHPLEHDRVGGGAKYLDEPFRYATSAEDRLPVAAGGGAQDDVPAGGESPGLRCRHG